MGHLLGAWVERKKWEARLQAVEVVKTLSEAMSDKKEPVSISRLAAWGIGPEKKATNGSKSR